MLQSVLVETEKKHHRKLPFGIASRYVALKAGLCLAAINMRLSQKKAEHKLRKKNANFRKSHAVVIQYNTVY